MEPIPAKRRRLKHTPKRSPRVKKVPRYPAYRFLEKRIKSFEKKHNKRKEWPIPRIQSPDKLAEIGLFYEGERDLVKCFSCGGGHSDWLESEDPSFEHAKCFPNCAFTLERKGKQYVDEVRQDVKNYYSTEESRLSSFKDFWQPSSAKTPEELAAAGFYHTGFSDEVQCFECGISIKNWNVDDVAWFKHAKRKPSCKFVVETKGDKFLKKVKEIEVSVEKNFNKKDMKGKRNSDQPVHSEYKTVVKRLASFKNWSKKNYEKPEDLAEIGLFYTGVEDYVTCFNCSGSHYGWKPDEVPSIEHARWYPACKLIRQIKGEKFVKEVRQKFRDMYETEESRKETFKNWPKEANKTPKELYKAGFFSTENDDQTQCFDCGHWHIDWEIFDDPWFVHAKLNPSCEFVRRIKGELFVNKVEQVLSSSSKKMIYRKRKSEPSLDESSDSENDVIPTLMKSSTIQTVLEIGFDDCKIQRALRDHLKVHEKIKSAKALFAIAMKSQKDDPIVSACLRNLEEDNIRFKNMKVCEICDKTSPIMLCVPCGHLHSSCFCLGKNLRFCVTCKKPIEHELEMFPEGGVTFLNS